MRQKCGGHCRSSRLHCRPVINAELEWIGINVGDEHAIRANAVVAVTNRTDALGRERPGQVFALDNEVIVAEAVTLGEP